jgi:hypothetical protein
MLYRYSLKEPFFTQAHIMIVQCAQCVLAVIGDTASTEEPAAVLLSHCDAFFAVLARTESNECEACSSFRTPVRDAFNWSVIEPRWSLFGAKQRTHPIPTQTTLKVYSQSHSVRGSLIRHSKPQIEEGISAA